MESECSQEGGREKGVHISWQQLQTRADVFMLLKKTMTDKEDKAVILINSKFTFSCFSWNRNGQNYYDIIMMFATDQIKEEIITSQIHVNIRMKLKAISLYRWAPGKAWNSKYFKDTFLQKSTGQLRKKMITQILSLMFMCKRDYIPFD